MFKRKLLKRALPIILSVAMVFEAMPATALAAEYEDVEIVEEADLEETVADGEDNEADNAETKEVDVQEENSTPQETETAGADTDDNKIETNIVTETENVTEVAEAEIATEAAETVEVNAEAALVTEITANNLRNYVSEYGHGLRYTDDVVTGTYTGEGIFDEFVNERIKSTSYDLVQIKVDGAVNANLKSSLTYKWKKADAEGNYTIDLAAGETPTDAGDYRLEISLDSITGVCNAAAANIDFKIEQIEIQLADLPTSVKIGETLTAFVEGVKEDYTLRNKKDTKEQFNKEIFVKSFEVTLVDAVTGEKLSYDANTVFTKDKDYAYTVSAELNNANYKLEETGQIVIGLSGDIETSMEITLPKLIEYTYTGEKIALPAAGTDYTVKVTYDAENEDGSSVKTEITNPTVTAEWADADGIKFDEGDAPVNAGSYQLVLTFTDTTGRYAECEKSINVTVNPISVYVQPSLTQKEYPSGASERDILKNVDYQVLKTADNQEPTGFKKDTFWGVSYNNTDRTQPYEPVFILQVSKLLLDADDKPVKDADGKVQYSAYVNNNNASLIAGSADGNLKAQYRVVFSGKKAVYYANGNAISVDVNDHGTNGADTNHKVDLSADTISKYVADVTITEAKLATIDTSEFANDVKTKIYDGLPFYENRKEYKKAKASEEGGTLTYTWRKAQKVVSTDLDGNEIVEYELGDEVFAQNDTDVNENKYWGVSPYEVGTYMLVISYNDSTGASVAKAAQVGPYVIEKQKVKAEISVEEGAALVSYTGVLISEFKEDCETGVLDVVKPIVDNVLEPEALGEALEWSHKYYNIVYVVEYQNNLNGEWKEVTEGAFEENRKYRLRAKVEIKNSTLNKYYQSYELNKDNEEEFYLSNALDIDVKKMGTTEIAIQVDESKITNKVKKYDGEPFAVPTEAVSVITVKDGQPVTDIELTYKWYDHVDSTRKAAAIDSGEYTLYISFAGNETYKPYDGEITVTGYEITERSITVKPVVKETVTAGTAAYYSNVVTDYVISDGSDILEAERFLFDGYYDEETGIALVVIDSTTGVIYEPDGKTKVLNNVLKGDKTYYAAVTKVNFNEFLDDLFYFSRNYEVKYEMTEFKPIRGNAIVTGNGISIKDYVAEMTHTIAPKEGVPYYYNWVYDEKGKPVSGNFIVFDVRAPQEYFVNGKDSFIASAFAGFVYENSVKEAGGYVIDENQESGQIRIAIPITKEDVNDGTQKSSQKSFKIRWEDGYVETFTIDCKGIVLEDDLSKAVAPKSLAFNSPVTKMIVGEKQQLDVKVTKTNLDDIICLKYVTADTTVLSVSDTGAVVALSKGNATVEVIPCYIDENGEKQPIDGAKHATAKISVADVTAPKIKSVTAYDRSAEITYPAVSDGYRREIYVLEGKNLKNDAFESKISTMKNGDWKTAGFAVRPVYDTHASTDKGVMTEVRITGLQPGPNKDYTVYVRNVSGIRTLADGTTVAASAAGSVKSFSMMLPQVRELGITFEKNYELEEGWYRVPLSEKSVSTITTGWFEEIYTDSAANTGDRKEYVLPLDKELAAKYAQPNLNYYVSKYYDEEEIRIDDLKNTSWSAATDIAKIDKKGKLTLTGVGIVYVLVVDTVTENYDILPFIIDATADRMEIAKSAKLKVGQKVDLFDLVTYYEGNTKLTGYVDYKSDLAYYEIGTPINLYFDATGDTDGFIIETQNKRVDSLRKDLAGEITAVKPNAAMTVKVTDDALNQEPVTLTVTSSAIDPVKSLKTTMVTDQYATISFTYPLLDTDWEWYDTSETESSNQVYFRIQVKDASKRVVSDRYYNMFSSKFYHELDAKNNVILTTTLDGFTRKSSYTVSVTACYLDQMSKEVSTGIKTTDVPAAYPYEHGGSFDYEYSKLPNSEYMTADGGIGVTVGSNAYLGSYPTLTSNNTYTLVVEPENWEAKDRLSDTLTWKSTNTKVASVKANAGTYTATLKTVRKGTTKIEISSKLTKRIIARWTVIVNAVGEASYYFGDLDTTRYEGMNEAEYGELQLLTIDNPVRATLESGEGMSAKFVAPAYGEYEFTSENLTMRVYDVNGESKSYLKYSYSQPMEQGETLYFRIPNGTSKRVTATLRAEGTIYKAMDLSGITLTARSMVVFTAPEDNYYSVYRNGSDEPYTTLRGMKQGETSAFSLPAGTYTVGKRTITGTLTTGELKDVTIAANTTNWYVFTAPEDMEYTFAKTSNDLIMRFYDDIISHTYNSRTTRTFEKGEKVYIAIVNNAEEEVKTDITISAAAEVISATQPSTITLTDANKEVWAQLKLQDQGKYNIQITATAEGEATPKLTVLKAESTSSSGDKIALEDDYDFSKGQIIYLSLSSDTANTKVTVTVSKVTGTTQPINEDSTEAAINTDSYVFTAQTAGEYVFSAEPIKGTDDAEIPVYVRVYDAEGTLLLNTRSMGRAASSGSYTLAAGQRVYVRYYTEEVTAATKTTVRISKLSAEVFTDTWKGIIKTGETKWLQFKAPADARYYFTTEPKQTTEDGAGSVNGYVPSTGYYKQGQGFEAKLTAYNADMEYTITVSPVNPEVLTNAEFELKANETKWFKYTASETGKYKEALTGDVKVSRYSDLVSLGDVEFSNEISLKAGETTYYKVENAGDTVQKATLTVTQITAEEMTLESNQKEKELSNGEYVWYSFKASKPGYYRIEAAATAEEGSSASAELGYYKKLDENKSNSKDSDSNLKVVYLAANETVFAKVTCNTSAEKAKVTTKLTAMSPTDVTPASAPVEKKDEKIATSGSCNWYSISGEGTYALTISDTTSSSYTIYYAKNGTATFSSKTNAIELTLGTEDIYTIAVRADVDEFGYTLTTTKRDVKQLTLTESVSASLKQGDELYVSFTVPETGRYAVMLDGLTDDVTANMSEIGNTANYSKNTDTYRTFYNKINDKVIFKIDGVNSATDVNFTIKAAAITKETVTDLTESGKATIDVNNVTAGHMSWYAYTAPESGMYMVKSSESASTIAECDILNASFLNDISDFNNQAKPYYLSKGVTKYWAVWYGKKPSANVEFSINKLETHELTSGGNLKVETKDVVPGERYRVTFTAPEDGMYSFFCAEEVDTAADTTGSPLVSMYECYNEYRTDHKGSLYTNYMLQKDEKIIFDAVYTNGALKSYTISAVKQEIKPIAAEGTEFTLKAGEYQYVSITPETSCNIAISVEAAEGIRYSTVSRSLSSLRFKDEFKNSLNGSMDAVASVSNAAYIGFYADVEGTVKVSYTAGEQLETLVVGDNSKTVETDMTMSFTAEETGVYYFISNGSRLTAQVGDVRGTRDVYIRKGDTALVTVPSNGFSSRVITVVKQTVTQMSLNSKRTLNFDDGLAYMEFSVDQEGLYVFSSDVRSSVDLYEIKEQSSGWNSVDDIYVNSFRSIKLDAGKYIAAVYDEDDEDYSADYTISYYGKCLVVDEADEDTPTHFTVNKNEVVYVKYYAYEAVQFDIKANNNVKVEYLPTILSDEILIGTGKSISTLKYISSSESDRYVPFFKITGTQDNTNVSISHKYPEDAKILTRGYNGIYANVEQDNYVGYVDYTYLCEQTGNYNFKFNYESDGEEGYGISKIEIYSATNTLLKEIDYSQSVAESYYMAYGTEYRIRIYTNSDSNEFYINLLVNIGNVTDVPYHYLVASAGTARFTFTAPENGMYKFYSTYAGEGTDTVAYLYDTETNERLGYDDDHGFYSNFRIEYELSEGQTVRLETRPYDSVEESLYYVHIEKLAAEYAVSEAPYDQTVSGYTQFIFTAPVNGKYEFYSTYVNGIDTKACLYDSTGRKLANDDNGGEGNNFRIECELSEGQTVRLEVFSPDRTGLYGVHIGKSENQHEVSYLPYDSEWVSGSVQFIFEAPESGNYEFYSTSDIDTVAYLYDNKTNEQVGYDNEGGDGNNFRIECELRSGQTVRLETRPYNSGNTGTYRVHINKVIERYIVGELPYDSGEVSGTVEFIFEAPESGNYEFYSTSSIDTVAYLYDNKTNEQIGYNDDGGEGSNFRIEYELGSGQIVRLQTGPLSSGNTGSYSVHIKKVIERYVVGELPYDSVEVSGTVEFIFEAPESWNYEFYSTSDIDTVAYLYDNETNERIGYDDDGGEGSNFRIECELGSGRIVRLQTGPLSSGNTGTYSVHVGRVIEQYKVENLPYDSEDLSDTVEFIFQAPKSGNYEFYSTGNASIEAYLYDNKTNDQISYDFLGGEDGNFRIGCELSAGQVVRLWIELYSSGNAGSYSIHIYKATEEYEVDKVPYNHEEISGSAHFIFQAPERAKYEFYSTGNVYTEAYLYDTETSERIGYNDDGEEGNNFRIICDLSEGQVVRLEADPADLDSYSIGIDKIIEEYTVADLPYTSEEVRGPVQFIFTVPEDGTYEFYSEGDIHTEAFLFNNDADETNEPLAYDDQGGEGNNFRIEHKLSEGQTVRLETRPYSSINTDSYIVHINKMTDQNEEQYEVGESDLPYNKEVSGSVQFIFTVPEEGTYEFYSEGDINTVAHLYDNDNENETELARDVQEGEGNNFRIECELSANQVVRLETSPYNSKNTDLYTVCIAKVTNQEIDDPPVGE